MDQAQWQFLLSEKGQSILAEMAETPITEDIHLQVASRLRKEFDPHLAQAVIETVWLRQRAADKFSRAGQMYFTRQALEQSSSEIVSTYRAQRFFDAGFGRIADLGCSIGGDALALAAKADVIGIDLEWLRLAMARENLQAYGNRDRFFPLQADLAIQAPLRVEALFFDPARRDEQGKRLKSVHLYRPPLSLIDGWRKKTAHAAVKVSPGIDYTEIPLDAQVEFISVSGSVKECVLWYGDLQRGHGRQATLLPGEDILTLEDTPGPDVPAREPAAYLYEPDGAVIRAHLIQTLARRLEAAPIDASIAYLTADDGRETPFARCFAIEDWFPFQLKRLRHYLRERNIGRVTIKKRGSPLEPEVLQRRLRLKGDEEGIIFLTHVLGEPAVLIGKEANFIAREE